VTGPEHYANAEADLDNAARASDKGNQADVAYWTGCAQVHATLALTAAHVAGLFLHPDEQAAWDHATGTASDAPEVTR